MRRSAADGATVVACARTWIGTPYTHQASRKGVGADCLGLIRGVWRELNGPEPFDVPIYAESWAERGQADRLESSLERYLLRDRGQALSPGNVLLFKIGEAGQCRHLGIFTDSTRGPGLVHAYSRHGVVESSLTTPWLRRLLSSFAFPSLQHSP